jgi:DNA-binding winged helix-turn-helix (wHTH) protein/Tol biopolymer transport system component
MPNTLRFGAYEVNLPAGQLYKHGIKIGLRDQSFQVLAALLERPGEVVTREELRKRLWSADVFVDFDNNLNAAVGRLREALGDSADHPHFIETLPKRGYRFLENVSEPPETHTYSKRLRHVDSPNSEGVASSPLATGDLGVLNHAPAQVVTPDSVGIADLLRRHKRTAMATVAIVVALIGLAWFLWRHPTVSPAELTQRRLTFNSSENPVQRSAISPDGKYLAYSDAAGIHVKLISTGEEHMIPKPARALADARWVVDSWFPDGTQLLADTSQAGGHGSMWAVSALGQSARELREDAEGYEVSPDGTHIVFAPLEPGRSNNPREIWVVDSQGDNPHRVVVRALGEDEESRKVHWSPDGNRLAYSNAQLTPTGDIQFATIETRDVNGTKPTVIVSETDSSLGDFWWLPDGRIVYVRTDESSGDDNLWQISIDGKTGTPTGKPKQITQWAGSSLDSLSASADGKRLAFSKLVDQWQVYIGELARDGTRLLGPLRRLRNQETDDRPSGWTADSKAVLFDSFSNGTSRIFKQGVNESTAQPLVAEPQNPIWPRISADGNLILYIEDPKAPSARFRMMSVPVNGGVPQFVLETATGLNDECARPPSNLCVGLEESQDDKNLIVGAIDPIKGRGKVLRTL